MQQVLIDTDPGIDDAMAIHFAFAHPGIEVLGLSSIFGNVRLPTATRNALRLVEMAGARVPVAAGAAVPLVRPPAPPGHAIHGEAGFGTVPAREPAGRPDARDAARFLVDEVTARPGEVILCPIGPLTNLARALRLDPGLVDRVAGVVVMGGAVHCPGNVSPWAEANIWHDPHAAAEVFAASWPVTLVGLDVTERVRCSPADLDRLAGAAPRIGGFLSAAADFYFDWHRRRDGFDGCYLHDPAALLAAVEPEWFRVEEAPIRVETEGAEAGRTRIDRAASTPPVRICTGVDAQAARERFLTVVGEADAVRAARLAGGTETEGGAAPAAGRAPRARR